MEQNGSPNNRILTKKTPDTSNCTLVIVSTDTLPYNQLALPQHSPQQFSRAAADLDHLPREGDVMPQRALRIVMANTFSEPHLRTDRRGVMLRVT